MKKQYIFLSMLIIILGMIYLIGNYKYKEYKINSYIDDVKKLNEEIRGNIEDAMNTIDYKTTMAYKNKLLKQEQGLKNMGEKVVYLTSEKDYNKFTDPNFIKNYQKEIIKQVKKENDELEGMNNFQRWIYFIFGKKIL